MTPSPEEIDEAFDLLDWIPLPRIVRMRAALSSVIQQCVQAKVFGGPTSGSAPEAWPRDALAILYVLWVTSNEFLAQQMRVESGL